MNKLAKLTSIAKGLAAGGILGASGGVAATHQIRKNKNSARSIKGWDTRRSISKQAEYTESPSTKIRRAVYAIGSSIDHPARAIPKYVRSTLVSRVRRTIRGDKHATTFGPKS